MGRAGDTMGWFGKGEAKNGGGGGWLTRLARDRAGNTLALMAAVMIPMCALAGSAIDTARMYVVKVRLQQACDAGALAGRKFMADSNDAALDSDATDKAKTFFANNFSSGYMGTPAFTKTTNPYPFTPSKTADKQVAGTASVAVPMTVMKMFGFASQTITVNCQARYDIADTDVMFVLDTTGSMACAPSQPDSCGQPTVSYTYNGNTSYKVSEAPNSRISALRSAVLSFYDTVAANVDPSTHVRYGIVPYTSTVNAGKAITDLSANYMVSQWNYDTRHIVGDYKRGDVSTYGTYNVSAATCSYYNNVRNPTSGYDTKGAATLYNTSYNGVTGQCTITQQTVSPNWRYENWQLDVSQYVASLDPNKPAVDDPSKITAATSRWQGCIEERDTTVATSFDPNNLPPDLDPDLVPSSDATRWRPMWPDVIYYRGNNTQVDDAGSSTNPYGDSNNNFWFANPNSSYLPGGYLTCGKPVMRLQPSLSRSDLSNYVNAPDFVPWGGTYHDTGMIWGVRMLSPNGIFAGDTAAWAGRNAPNRYIVFMTDGHMATNQYIYGMYGWENYDQRTTGGNFSNSDAMHNARFLAECQAAKNRNIKVFVVSLASTLDPSLTSCASANSAYYASDSASLTAAFKNIATQVARLRITQ